MVLKMEHAVLTHGHKLVVVAHGKVHMLAVLKPVWLSQVVGTCLVELVKAVLFIKDLCTTVNVSWTSMMVHPVEWLTQLLADLGIQGCRVKVV
jgi:hypothetical protein